MVSMQTNLKHARQLSVMLVTVIMVSITAAIGLCDTVLGQAQDADVAVMFLVDESLSSAAIAGGEKETLYNVVRFMNGALAVACQPGQCQTGVSRFSAKPTQLVPLKSVEEWDERDFLRLEIGVQDRIDQSDFPAAFEETCRQMHRSSDAHTKVLVVLTDGQVGSQESPNIAPVQRARATNRATFVEQIRASVDFCRDNDIRLVTVLLDPSDMEGGQPGVDLDEGDDSRQSYRNQERELWKTLSETSDGAMIEAPAADDVLSVRNVMASLEKALSVTMPEYAVPDAGTLDLGNIGPYQGSAQFEIIGLKPFSAEAEAPDSSSVPSQQVRQMENRVSMNIPLPQEGPWVAKIPMPMADNLFIVRPPLTSPMRLQPHLTQPAGSAEYVNMPLNGWVPLELETVPMGGDTPVVIDGQVIAGILTSPIGLKHSIKFTADTSAKRYRSDLFSTVTRPEPGLYELWIPTQAWEDVIVDKLQQGIVLVADPIVLDWHTQPDSPTAGSPLSIAVVIANSKLLRDRPQLAFEWRINGKSPINQSEFGDEQAPGQYVVTLRNAPDTDGTYQLSVGLLGGINVFGKQFPASDPVMREIKLMKASETGPSEPPTTHQLSPGGLVFLAVGVVITLVILLWCLRRIVLWSIPKWYERRSDPLAVHSGIERLTGIGWASRYLGPIRPRLEEIHEERLQEIEVGQKNRAVDSSLKLLRKEQRQVCQKVTDLGTWERVTAKVLGLVNSSRGEIRAIRTTAASNLFNEILEKWQDSDATTEIDLVNHLNRQGFETYFDSSPS